MNSQTKRKGQKKEQDSPDRGDHDLRFVFVWGHGIASAEVIFGYTKVMFSERSLAAHIEKVESGFHKKTAAFQSSSLADPQQASTGS